MLSETLVRRSTARKRLYQFFLLYFGNNDAYWTFN